MNDEIYSITRIFDKRVVNNKIEYMVAFKGFHIGLSEWVSEENLRKCQNEIDYYEAKIKGLIPKGTNILGRPSKFANDYDFIHMRGKMSKEHYKAYQMKDEFESESDYEELKLDYLEARKRMELEEERKQLIGIDACSNKDGDGSESKKTSKYKKKICKKKAVVAFEGENISDCESIAGESPFVSNISSKDGSVESQSINSELVESTMSSDDDDSMMTESEDYQIDDNNSSSNSEISNTHSGQRSLKNISKKGLSCSKIKKSDLKSLNNKGVAEDIGKKILSAAIRSRRSRIRIESSESDSDMKSDKVSHQKTVIETFIKTMDASYTVESKNFLTFVEIFVLENKKLVVFLTQDKQYLMINEDQIPSELEAVYKTFLIKKGLFIQ